MDYLFTHHVFLVDNWESDSAMLTLNVKHHLYYFLLHSRYHELFFMIDTCQAESLFQKFYSPNILAVASSKVGEDSLSVSSLI